jgi:hypothetical protein
MNIIEEDIIFQEILVYWTRLLNRMAAQAQRFNQVARTEDELNDLMAHVLKTNRDALGARDKEKLHQNAIAELPTKFTLLTVSDDKDQLNNAYNIMRRKQEFFARLDKFDMAEPFSDVLTFDNDGNLIQGTVKSLRDNSIGASIEEVARSNQYYNQFGQSYDVQDLNWSQELLENSCDSTLRDKVMENLLLYPRNQHGGPLFY